MWTRRAHLNSFKLTSLTLSIIVPEKFELENSRLAATGVFKMKAFVLQAPGRACIETVPDPVARPGDLLLQVRMVGFCGSDLNSFRGLSPLVSYPRILGHEVCATVVQGDSEMAAGTDVALLPYSNCGRCAACLRGRPNACQYNETLGVQRDGALAEYIAVPREKLYPARLAKRVMPGRATDGGVSCGRSRKRFGRRHRNDYWVWRSRAGRSSGCKSPGSAHDLR